MIKTIMLLANFFFAQVAGTGPPEVITITGPPTCAQCVVDLELEVTLADRPDLELPIVGITQNVVRDSAGRILLTHNVDPAHVFEFGADGTFIQAVGRQGEGPGDFIIAGKLILGEDGELYVFDRVQRRMTVFSAGLEVLDTERLPVPPRDALFVSDGLVAAGHTYSRDMIGLPMHFLTPRFELSKSFGTTDETARRWVDGLQPRADVRNSFEVGDPERLYDSIIEVIDPSSGALLASARVPQFLSGFTNDGLMIGFREPDDDVPYLDLWKAKLIR